MMSSITSRYQIILLIFLASSLSNCASIEQASCDLGGLPVTDSPRWVSQTAFEMRLPAGFYYGKGISTLRESYKKRRDEAKTNAYANLAQQVSVKIFSRTIIQQTNDETRAEAVAKAISDVNAHGIDIIREWQDGQSCALHVMARVSQKVAGTWKRAAESYLVHRPGLGMVRRTDEDIHAINYREIGQPKLFIQWDEKTGADMQKFMSGGQVIFEQAFRKTLKQNGIKFAPETSSAKFLITLRIAGISQRQITMESQLRNPKNGNKIAIAARGGDYQAAQLSPRQSFGFESQNTSSLTRNQFLKITAQNLAKDLLNDWLSDESAL